MESAIFSEFFRFLEGGTAKQFRFVTRTLMVFTTALLTSLIYSFLFGKFSIKMGLDLIISNCLDPKGLFTILFFISIYFGFYPFVGISAIVLYRARVYHMKKIPKSGFRNFEEGFEISGTKEVMDKIPEGDAKILLARININMLDDLNSFVVSLSYLFLSVLIIFLSALKKYVFHLWIGIFSILFLAGILLLVLFILPKFMRMLNIILKK